MLSLRHLRFGILTLAITATVLAVMATSGLHVETDLVELLPRTTPGFPSTGSADPFGSVPERPLWLVGEG